MVEKMPTPEDSGTPVDLMRLAIALWRRRRHIATAVIIGTAAGAVVAKTLVPAVFEARSVIECDRCAGRDQGDRELATLQESVKLPHHLEKARQKLGLDMTIEKLGLDVEVNASLESRLIQVTARAKSGTDAATIANTIVDELLETRAQVERDMLDQRVRMLKTDAEKARLSMLDARAKYDQFRIDNGIGDLPVEREAAILEAAKLRNDAAIAHTEERSQQARIIELQRVTSNESVTAIIQQVEDMPESRRLGEAKAELARARGRFSADHPQVLALSSEVETLERKLAGTNESIPTTRTVGPNQLRDTAQQNILRASADKEAARTRQSMYEKLAQKAEEAVARLSKIEGQAVELLAHLQNAERHALTIEQDLKAAEDAARTPSTGLRILAQARVPEKPAKSSRRLAALLGPIVGSIVASLFIVLRELRGIRIHTAAELAFWGKGPVLVASQWPRATTVLDDLATDLVGPLRHASGKTLVLGAGLHETPHVQELVDKIRELLQHELSPNRTSGSIEALMDHGSTSALRRAVHDVDRVIVLVAAAIHSGPALRVFIEKVACPERIGFVLLNLHEDHAPLSDLAGDAQAFWNAQSPFQKAPARAAMQ